MEELCKKFPKICNCPYKEDIDNDLKKGKTAYYINKWLKDTDCPISYDTIRKYQKYLIEHGEITQEQRHASPTEDEEELLTQLQKKAKAALTSLDMDNLNDNVKVQLILGACKLIYGNKHYVAADVTNDNTHSYNFDNEILGVIGNALERRNHNND